MNIRIIVITAGFISAFLNLKASLSSNGIGARSSAMGNTSVTLMDFWSQFNNQAGLSDNKSFSVGSFYESRFLLKSLSVKAIGVLIPVNNGSFGVNLLHFGDVNFNEINIGLAYGRRLSKNLSVGLQFDYFSLNQGGGYGSTSKITFEGGFIYKVDEQIIIGGHLYNPLIKSNSGQGVELPEIYRLGIEYLIRKGLSGYFEAISHTDLGSSLHFGLEYNHKSYSFRAGYASNPDQFTFGIGFKKAKFMLDFSSNLHSVLGYSPQLSVVYIF